LYIIAFKKEAEKNSLLFLKCYTFKILFIVVSKMIS